MSKKLVDLIESYCKFNPKVSIKNFLQLTEKIKGLRLTIQQDSFDFKNLFFNFPPSKVISKFPFRPPKQMHSTLQHYVKGSNEISRNNIKLFDIYCLLSVPTLTYASSVFFLFSYTFKLEKNYAAKVYWNKFRFKETFRGNILWFFSLIMFCGRIFIPGNRFLKVERIKVAFYLVKEG